MNGTDRRKPPFIGWCKSTSKLSLHRLRLKPDRGCPTLSKTNSMHFLCGILAHGFLRRRCANCAHEKLVTFSCKRRGFCPSCGGRRMAQTAAYLVDHIIPRAPVRQWVLSLPISCPSAFAHIDIASHSPCHLNFSDQIGRIETIRSTDRCDTAYSTFRFGC
jgi:ribosomal protein S27E